ncbi:MAG: hypothetical protein JXQ73_33550 [Phycisphaerae bacterium]|nr:hypothetical protein [Phycisphaerae bacterium]
MAAWILGGPAAGAEGVAFRLSREVPLTGFGGVPFCFDVDGDGAVEILWLQSPGMFHSMVYDVKPWKGKWTEAERNHFCLTATDAKGKVLWRIGEPWRGDRPFVTHGAERAVDCADIDGDGVAEVVCVRRGEILVIDGRSGRIERSVKAPSDNVQIVRLGHTGRGPNDWTILAKNSEKSYPPHEYANPAWFYTPELKLLRTCDYHGAGHAPQALDIDGDGLDEFVIGYNLVDHDLRTVWTYRPTSQADWDAGEMHVDGVAIGRVGSGMCIAVAASNLAFLLDARDGRLIWRREGVHPQHCQIGRFDAKTTDRQVFIHNKRADLQLYDLGGKELWRITPPESFPVGRAAPCKRQKFHVFDATTVARGLGPGGTDLLIFTDGGWPYVIDGAGRRCAEFPYTPNIAQDWGEVPGRPDDYGYGYYARVADFDGDGAPEVLLNDRRFAWFYEASAGGGTARAPRSDARILHVDFENYTDGVVQPLNAGIRWLGDPFSGRKAGTVEVTKGFAFGGSRCGHIRTEEKDQIGRIRFQKRFDAPSMEGDSVVEVIFRAVRDGAVDMEDIVVLEPQSKVGGPVGLAIRASGEARSGTYRLDVVHAEARGSKKPARADGVVEGSRQGEWLRLILHRRKAEGVVDLWVGRPDRQERVGTWPDLDADADLGRAEVGDTSTSKQRGSGCWDDLRLGGVLGDGGQVAPPEPRLRDVGREKAVIETPIVVGRARRLFVDDALVESSSGLKRTLHAVRKHPSNPVLVPERAWEGKCVLLYGGVMRDPASNKFRMWYLAWGKHVGLPSFICYAESDDGLRWVKPSLGLHEFRGSKDNNIVITDITSNTTIIHDEVDPDPGRRYKAVIRGRGTRGYTSPDGLRWKDIGVLLDQCYDSTSVQWDPVGRKWIASAKIFRDGKRARGYAESKDFIHWTDTYFQMTVDDRDRPDDQMYALTFFRYESVYLGLLRMFHTDTGVVDIQLTTSRNAKHWDREHREPFIPTTPQPGAWDYGNNSPATNGPIRVGDELWFYYSGRGTHHDEVQNTGAIGLGTLRVDGFVSLDAGDVVGTLTTKLLRLAGKALYVNANAALGEVRVEILGGDGRAMDSFSKDGCVALAADGIGQAVGWRGAHDLSSIGGMPVRLRFHLRNAALYAFWVE